MWRVDHWKRLWCCEGLGAGGEVDDRGWDGWMASPTQWTWVWVNSGSWWWTGRPGVLQFMGLQRVRHNWATDLIWSDNIFIYIYILYLLTAAIHVFAESDMTWRLNNNKLLFIFHSTIVIIKLSPLWLESAFEIVPVSFPHSLYTLIISLLSGLRCSKNIFYFFSPGYGISNFSRGMFPVIAKGHLESSTCILGKKGLLQQEIKTDSPRKMLIHLILSNFIILKVFLLF